MKNAASMCLCAPIISVSICVFAVKSASSVRRSADIISMLVNIYGSKEVFVNEYRTLLADRILTHYNYDTARELRYLELLKLRFGETQLHACEVMLKDVADSKRLNTRIREQWEQETGDEKEKVRDCFHEGVEKGRGCPSEEVEKIRDGLGEGR